jgi:hypothetical protein
MNDEAALPGRPDAIQTTPSEGSSDRRRPPSVVIELPLEQPGRITLVAHTLEDERRLRVWLRRSREFQRLPGILARLLDDLDDADRMAA